MGHFRRFYETPSEFKISLHVYWFPRIFPSFEETATAKDIEDMVTELNVMKRLKPHPHVLKLIGCCGHSGKSNRKQRY